MAGLLPVVLAAATCAPPLPAAREFELRGQILALRPDNEVLIKHEDIKGFLPAMTLPYKVRQPALLQGKGPRDLITATLVVHDTDAWLTRLEKTGSAPITEAVPEQAPTGRVRLLQPGDPAPDTALTGDQGHTLPLRAWRGSAVALTFTDTRCPRPQFCPMMRRALAP